MNDGEKELMKLWNLHLMKNRLVNFLGNQIEQSLLLFLFNLLKKNRIADNTAKVQSTIGFKALINVTCGKRGKSRAQLCFRIWLADMSTSSL